MATRHIDMPDRDWWMPHVLLMLFGVLVAAILAAVPGWSAPLRVWIALDSLVVAGLSADAAARAVACAARRRWNGAVVALLLALALGASAALLAKYGHSRLPTLDDAMTQPAPFDAGPAR